MLKKKCRIFSPIWICLHKLASIFKLLLLHFVNILTHFLYTHALGDTTFSVLFGTFVQITSHHFLFSSLKTLYFNNKHSNSWQHPGSGINWHNENDRRKVICLNEHCTTNALYLCTCTFAYKFQNSDCSPGLENCKTYSPIPIHGFFHTLNN